MKTIILLFSILSFGTLMAQSVEISGKYDKIGKFEKGVAIVRQKDKVGVINSEGKEIIKPEYDKITAFGNDGIAYSHKKNLVGLINREGRVIADNQYDYIGHFKGGNAIVKKNGLSGVINKEGKIIVDMKYDKLSCEEGGVIRATNADGTMTLIKPNN
ncbi:MAG: WG repeat-containing protein [Burkholderiales bacterium]|nr:WG repeat-containing protein [Bacteroidia bacterium]